MAATQLGFSVIGTYPYPYSTTGIGTCLTVCRFYNDPMLAFLTQTTFEDEIVYLHLHLGVSVEAGRVTTPAGQDTISGMAYDQFERLIWAVQGTVRTDTIIGIDPDNGTLVRTINVPSRFNTALAFNGLFFVRSDGRVLESITKGGVVIGSVDVPIGSSVQDMTASFFSYVATDTARNRLVVLGLFGRMLGECTAPPGAPGGITAVAFDNLQDMDQLSQLPTENGAWGDEGTAFHPDTPWNPAPFVARHNIYLANEVEQLIYFGYFFAL